MKHKISIIIPILNEAENIISLLEYLVRHSGSAVKELIIVDGGSTDNSIDLIHDFIDSTDSKNRCIDALFEASNQDKNSIEIHVFEAKKGRAHQMNVGAKNAQGDILYFLHADTFPPKNFGQDIIKEINAGNHAGCFRLKFDSYHPVLLVSQWFTRFNVSWCRGGDQSLFISNYLFKKMNGFNENFRIYEDCEFINRLYDRKEFTIIPKSVTTSTRKYRINGTWRLQYYFAMIHIKKAKGATPEELYAYYKKYVT